MHKVVFGVVWQKTADVVQARKRRDSKTRLGVTNSRDLWTFAITSGTVKGLELVKNHLDSITFHLP